MELLNEILVKVSQLSPSELSVLVEAAKGLQGKAASDPLCVDDQDEKKPDGLIDEN